MAKKDIGSLNLAGAGAPKEFLYTIDIKKIGSLRADNSMAVCGEDIVTVGFVITGGMPTKYKGVTRYPNDTECNQQLGPVISSCIAAMAIAKPITVDNKQYVSKRLTTAYASLGMAPPSASAMEKCIIGANMATDVFSSNVELRNDYYEAFAYGDIGRADPLISSIINQTRMVIKGIPIPLI